MATTQVLDAPPERQRAAPGHELRQRLRRPLSIVDRGMRLAAGTCDLGRELLASIQGHR